MADIREIVEHTSFWMYEDSQDHWIFSFGGDVRNPTCSATTELLNGEFAPHFTETRGASHSDGRSPHFFLARAPHSRPHVGKW